MRDLCHRPMYRLLWVVICVFTVACAIAASPVGVDIVVRAATVNTSQQILLTTPEDFKLPGTQPNTLSTPLLPCVGCHVDHISTNYVGSMMANSARDPLFRAALQVAESDAQFAGEFCIRCHAPNAWLNGRSMPSNGSAIQAADLQGVTCNACHRMVAPHALDNEAARNAAEREYIKSSQPSGLIIGSGAYIIDREDFRRGPFSINLNEVPHAIEPDSFVRSALLCATCHEIDNPLYTYNETTAEFELNALDTPAPVGAKLFPVERTYSEWASSAFNTPEGVSEISTRYPGLKRATNTVDGPITVCQDCHMPLIESPLVSGGTTRTVGTHDWAGGSSLWQVAIADYWGDVAGDTFFDEVAQQATLDARLLGRAMLARAADLDLDVQGRELSITVTNQTGHKLPTGYAEGRRMWLEVTMLANSQVVSRVGTLDDNGYIVAPLKVYEIKQGLSASNAEALGRPDLAGEGFHFALNNTVFKDNRIPPRGWTNAAYAVKSMAPVGVEYVDGQFADTTTLLLPFGVDEVKVNLWYQTASGEYLDFLQAEATTPVPDAVVGKPVVWGEVVGMMREQYDLDQGELMASATLSITSATLFLPAAGR